MSHRDKLARRKRPTRTFYVVLDESAENEDDQRLELTMRAVAAQRWDELLEAHPAPEGSTEDVIWGDGFIPALLAECVDGDITAEDWTEYVETGVLTPGEMAEIGSAAVELHWRGLDPK